MFDRPKSARAFVISHALSRRIRTLMLATGLVVAGLFAPAEAQVTVRRIGQAGNAGGDDAGKADEPAVFVRDSGVAVEKLALAERMERLKEWNKSADVYQEILEKFADRVIPSRTNQDGGVTQYASVALVVQEKLARWPEEGLTVYRALYEDSAKQLLEAAGTDRVALNKLFSTYFVTESAKAAGLRLMSLNLVEGEFTAAAWTGDRLLTLHPSLTLERPAVLYETAIALHLSNNNARAEKNLAELQGKFADASGTVRGQEVVYSTSLAEELRNEPGLTRMAAAGSWPTAFGGPERSVVPDTAVAGGAPLFHFDLTATPPRGITPANLKDYRSMTRGDRDNGMLTGVFPVIDKGELYFQDNARVYALSLDTGRPLAGWQATYPGDKRAAFALADAWPMPKQRQLTLTLTDRAVLAVMGQADVVAMGMQVYGGNGPSTQLVSLDRATGRRLWAAVPQQLKVPETAAALRGGQFFGTPLVVGDTVFVTARTSTGQIEDCQLVALALGDGSYKWSSYIASANSAVSGDDNFDGTLTAGPTSTSHLSYADGRVFVQTNLGALASVDASDGKIFWLSLYQRFGGRRPNPMQNRFNNNRGVNTGPPRRGFTANPPMLVDGKIFALPSDSTSVLIYDSGTGELVKEIPATFDAPGNSNAQGSANNKETVDTLVGVAGDRLVLCNGTVMYCVNWPAFTVGGPRNAGQFWNHSFTVADSIDAPIQGRPFLTKDTVIVPTGAQLLNVDLKRGAIRSAYPATKWDESESAGNVLASPEYLIVAGPEILTVYTDLALARKKLEAEIAAAPTAADPRLKYAEMMFAAGMREEALTRLDDAITALGGRATLTEGAGRDRLYEDALAFGTKLSKDKSGTVEMSNQLFERARAAAVTPVQQTRYRLARANAAREQNNPAAEIASYQEILANPAYRVTSPTGGPAGALVEKRIADMLRGPKGKELYDSIEKQAAEALKAARGATGPAAFLEVAEAFPNSQFAPAALEAAAVLFENQKNPRESARLLRRLFVRQTSSEAKVRTLEALARNYLALPGGDEIAIARLAQASRLAPRAVLAGALTLADGRVVEKISFAEAAELLRLRVAKAPAAPLPKIGFAPASETNRGKPGLALAVTIDRVAKIVRPSPEATRPDRLVAWHPASGLAVYAAGGDTPRVRVPGFTEEPILCAWAGDKVVVASATRVVWINDKTQKVEWENGLSSVPASDAVALATEAEEDPAPANAGDLNTKSRAQFQFQQQQRLRNAGLGRVGAPNAIPDPDETGQSDPSAPEQILRAKLLGSRLVVCTSTSRVISFDLDGGKPAWSTRVSENAPRHLMAIEDYVVVTTFNEQQEAVVTVLDSATGQVSATRSFGFEPTRPGDPSRMLVNAVLAKNGTLVLMLANSMLALDVYDPTAANLWSRPFAMNPGQNPNQLPFMFSTGRDQLVLVGDTVLAVRADGQDQRVNAYSLTTGEPLGTGGKSRAELSFKVPVRGAVGQPGQGVLIRNDGPYLYLWHRQAFTPVRLDAPGEQSLPNNLLDNALADLFIGSDHVVTVTIPKTVNGDRSPFVQFTAYSRSRDEAGQEEGVTDQTAKVTDPAQILLSNWQPVDGGIYYVSGDQKLKFLKTLRPE